MCGFVGFTNSINDDGNLLTLMTEKIIHRGPDSAGEYIDSNIALGFRRLSIVDIKDGDQPLENEDGNLVLIFNGEIYNHQKLRHRLISAGHNFKTDHCDSEVILHGFEEWGYDVVNKLRGMFSFIIYNKKDLSIFGARDIFGIKPFYYTLMENDLLFGSEIKSFMLHPSFKKQLNSHALSHFLSFQYCPTDETFFKGVYKLPPAHYFTYKNENLKTVRYYRPKFETDDGAIDYYADLIEETLKESVEIHKISADVEVGSFLSSGIDSSIIAKTAMVDKTFTVGFESDEGNRYDESVYAKEFADKVGLKNISKVISKEEYFNNFAKIQYLLDEPLADPAAIALYFVSRLASEHVKVVMSGEGADELFGGYRIYSEPLTLTLYDSLPFFIRRLISKICAFLPKKHGVNYLIRRGQTIEERYIGNANIFSFKERNKLLKGEEFKSAVPPKELCKKFYDEVKDKDDVTKMQYLDINMWLAGDILLKADKVSMANSIELRVPFLDKKVLELCLKLPPKCRVSPKGTKLALRKAAERSIPSVTAQKEKLGFPVPIRNWLKEEEYYNKVKDAFLSDQAQRFFNTKLLLKMLSDHKKGKADLSRKIWTVYTFIVWYKEYFG